MNDPKPTLLATDVIYQGRKLALEIHHVEDPDGRRADREIVVHKGSVAILAFRDAPGGREVLLERNYRYTVGDYMIEIPAGTLDRDGEDPRDCAARELIEETGFRAEVLQRLFTTMPSPGFLTEQLTVYVAERVMAAVSEPEAGELIRIIWTPWAAALDMVRRNEIIDGKTIAALLYYERFSGPAS